MMLSDRKINADLVRVRTQKNRQWCTVRAAVITFIIILIIILVVAIAVGVVFGVLGGQLNGNGTRTNTNNQDGSCRMISSVRIQSQCESSFLFSYHSVELCLDEQCHHW